MKRALALIVASTVALAACGSDAGSDPAGDPSGEPRTIEVSMTDMAYTTPGQRSRAGHGEDGSRSP